MSDHHLPIDQTTTGLSQLADILLSGKPITISAEAIGRISKCRDYLDNKLSHSDELFYGINTGFGFLQNVKIDKEQLQQLQRNLIQSHACGMGEELPLDIVKLMIALKIRSLSYGHSGVQVATVQRLIDMYNNNVLPVIYTQGSLGASGDLAPLS
ncbi:MAG TPA: aromatic amino acid lyase, partial [Ferruginibacter sp.]|nr:aromatic amino acid lyase [Ferruginibacter sp.]